MKQRYYIFLLFVAMLSYSGYAQKSILRLSQQTLMHEVRETPSPLDGQHIAVNPPRFMWPDKFPHLGPVLDGVEEEDHKPEVTYRIRIARDPEFKSETGLSSILSNSLKKGNGIGSTPTLIRTAKKNGRPSIISMWTSRHVRSILPPCKKCWRSSLKAIPVSCSMPKTGIRSSSGTRIIRKRSSIFIKQGNASIIH